MRCKRWTIAIAAITFALVLAAVPLWNIRQRFRHAQANYALVVAVYQDDTKAALGALHAGADPNTRRVLNDKPPTFTALVRHLWQQMRGATASASFDPTPQAPLIALAAAKKNFAVVTALLLQGAVPDAHTDASEENHEDDETDGETALMWAATNNDAAMTKALLSKGANPNFNTAGRGEAPLLSTTDPEVMETLIAHGANIHAELQHSKHVGITPLRYVLLKLMVSYEAERDSEESSRYYRCVETLIAHGADINENNGRRNSEGEEGGYDETALRMVAQHGKPADLRFVLSKGANLHASSRYGWDVLTSAIEDGRTENIRILLQHGMNPNKRDTEGSTPLLLAVAHGEDGPVKVLLEAGANVNVRDKHGNTPLQLAQEDDNGTVEDILRASGAKR